MSKTPKPEKAKPFSIRLTNEEKAVLEEKAAGMPLGIFIRSLVLDETIKPRVIRRQYPVKDAEPLARLLGMLGKSRLSSNLNQLAKAANLGNLFVTPDIEADLRRACGEIFEMRQLLLLALGARILNEVKEGSDTESLSPGFNEAASLRRRDA
jgi:hypothetical protein